MIVMIFGLWWAARSLRTGIGWWSSVIGRCWRCWTGRRSARWPSGTGCPGRRSTPGRPNTRPAASMHCGRCLVARRPVRPGCRPMWRRWRVRCGGGVRGGGGGGARRIAFDLAGSGVASPPSRATVHRVLVRNGLVRHQEQRHRRKYKRWQREAPMHLWQLDLVGGIYLADGRECKMLTGIDDHSRFVVVAAVLAVPSGRAVADAFLKAMRVYGVPAEVLTDNGKQFTGRFTKPRPAEVLFERVCRENGITQKLTKPYSPTTTGKIERWHQTLRRELLDASEPFVDLPGAQAAISAWVHAYNHNRPHQAIGMATPASLFRPGTQPEPLRVTVTSPSEHEA